MSSDWRVRARRTPHHPPTSPSSSAPAWLFDLHQVLRATRKLCRRLLNQLSAGMGALPRLALHAHTSWSCISWLVNLNVTCTPTPPLPDAMTLPQAAEAARGGRAQQHMVGRRVFELETPSTINPNHPTLRAHALLTPNASTHSRCSCAVWTVI